MLHLLCERSRINSPCVGICTRKRSVRSAPRPKSAKQILWRPRQNAFAFGGYQLPTKLPVIFNKQFRGQLSCQCSSFPLRFNSIKTQKSCQHCCVPRSMTDISGTKPGFPAGLFLPVSDLVYCSKPGQKQQIFDHTPFFDFCAPKGCKNGYF